MIKLPELYLHPRSYWAQLLTLRCNGNCPFCLLDRRGKHRKTEEITGKEIIDFWNNIEHYPQKNLSLIGGEPTLHPDLIEIVNNLENYQITLTTNCKTPFWNEGKYNLFNPKQNTKLRINTTFHPHHITVDEYVNIIKTLEDNGFWVDQVAFLWYPEYPYMDKVKEVEKQLGKIRLSPYMGFWSKEKGLDAEPSPENNQMDENFPLPNVPAELCGIFDYDDYREMCGQIEPKRATCWHPLNTLIVGSNGYLYHCHYRLYYDIDPICHISDFRPADESDMICDYYGFCNWCDIPHVHCIANPTAREIPDE